MRSFLTRLLGLSSPRKAKKRKFRKVQLGAEQLEMRSMMATTGIVVNDDATIVHGSDIVTFNYSGGTGGTFSVVESGSLPIPFFPSPGMPPRDGRNGVWEFVGMGDVNGDGKQDIIAKDSGKGSVTPAKNGQWWVGINNGSDLLTFTLWDGAVPIFGSIYGGTHQLTWGDHQVADFTGDGRADVLARVRETGNWYLWTTNATGTGFTTEATGITSKSSLFGTWNITTAVDAVTEHHYQWRDALVGDFNADGKADLAGRRITNFGVTDEWYVGLGTAATTNRGETGVVGNTWWNNAAWQHATTWANAVVGDFNGDGRDDIAGRAAYPTLASGTRVGEWWVSYTSATVGTRVPMIAWTDWNHAITGTQLHWRDVQSGDFNGDGKDDILGRTQIGELHLVDGATGLSSVVGTMPPLTYPVIVAGDFTGDGKIDLAARKSSDMMNQWYLSVFTTGGGSTFPTPVAKGSYRVLDTSLREDFYVKGSPQATLGSSLPLALLQDLGRYNPWGEPTEKDPQFILGRYNADGKLDWEGYGGGLPFVAIGSNSRLHLDFNGDDVQDILTQTGTGQWYYSENYGNSYVTASSNINWTLSEARIVFVGDFTGDHKDDLLSQKLTGPLSATWYLHASRGDGTFTTDVIHTRSYATAGPHVWLTGGFTGDFDNDGRDDITLLHKENDIPEDQTWVVEVVFSNGDSPTPANPSPTQPAWSAVYNWIKESTMAAHGFLHWGMGDFNGDGTDDVWGKQATTIIVGPPMLTEEHAQVWVGYGSGRGGGLSAGAVYTFPEIFMPPIDERGSKSGRFDSSADSWDDIVLEIGGGLSTQLRVLKSFGWTLDIVDTSGRSGGEQFALVGDMDDDGSDDLIWIGTTPNHNIDLFVRVRVETIPWLHSGEFISPNGVPSYIWTTSSRLRRRKPS
jgi:FG-GAP-like repeat